MEGYFIDVPLLMIHWHPSLAATTAINLDSTVVLPINKEDKTLWNAYIFEIIHVKKCSEDMKKMNRKNDGSNDYEKKLATRKFSVPEKERNEWLQVISTTMQEFEKRRAKDRTKRAMKRAQEINQIQRESASPFQHDQHNKTSDIFNRRAMLGGTELPPVSPTSSFDSAAESNPNNRTRHRSRSRSPSVFMRNLRKVRSSSPSNNNNIIGDGRRSRSSSHFRGSPPRRHQDQQHNSRDKYILRQHGSITDDDKFISQMESFEI